jgi:hypothetical protein
MSRPLKPSMFEKLATTERAQAAKQKTERVVDHLLYLLILHESNAIVVYSDTLASQIPKSYAANTFNVFQQGLYRFEIVRLCALWDRATPDCSRESIPTIVELIDDSKVIDALVEETRSNWTSPLPPDPSDDPMTDAVVQEWCVQQAQEKAAEASDGLKNSIATGREIENSTLLTRVRNLRDKHLAHSLSETSREKKEIVSPMKYGDERKLHIASTRLVKALHLWVNGASFDFDNSRAIARRNAEALWKHCTFEIQS